MFEYTYETQNIGSTSLYGFKSIGEIRKNELYEISPVKSVISFKDKSAGCDYTNLKNTLYHDFITDLDNNFIKNHKFYVDDQQDQPNKNLVKILYKSKKAEQDSGYFCIDTVDCSHHRSCKVYGAKI